MKKGLLAVLLLGSIFFLDSGAIRAHHGTAIYDPQRLLTLEGTVTEFKFMNPHAKVLIEVKDKDKNGNAAMWTIVCSAPAKLYRSGWNAKTLQPGDRIAITGYQRKDGKKEMAFVKLVLPDGSVL